MTRVESDSGPFVVNVGEEKNCDSMLDTARRAFGSGRTRSLEFRKKQLKGLAKFLEECEEEIVKTLQKDLRKHRQEAVMGELDVVLNDLRHTLIDLHKWAKPQKPEKRFINFMDEVMIYNDPYGVVLIIGAWNYPYMLTLGPLVGAIAGGNCVILKPSEVSPSTSEFMARTLPKYIDKECYQVFQGGIEETTEILNHKFDYIFFTGSTTVGKKIHQAAAKFLTPVTLELGGKSPAYIDDNVNMENVARRILWGKCLNAGQTCISPDYVLCNKETQEKFLAKAQEVLVEFFGGDSKLSPNLAKIVSERHYNRLVAFLRNGTVALGGKCDPRNRVIGPTILTNVNPDSPVMLEEIFGPILPVINVNSAKDAVEFINSRDKPLALYVFSRSRKIQNYFLENTSSGGCTINDTVVHCLTENLSFGGVGASGTGSYHGKAGFDTFTHQKSVLVRGLGAVSELVALARYPPYSDLKTAVIRAVTKKRRGINFGFLKNFVIFGLGIGFAYGVQCFYKKYEEK